MAAPSFQSGKKNFGDVKIIHGIDLDVQQGELAGDARGEDLESWYAASAAPT